MFRTILSVNLALMLAGAGLHLTAGTGQAASRGGGHGGGFHGGAGGHSGGYHGSGPSAGYHGGTHFGGYNGGTHLGGYNGSFHSGNLANFLPGAHYRTAARHHRNTRSFSGYYGAWPYLGYYYPTYPNYSDLGSGYGPGAAGSDEQSGLGDFSEFDSDPIVSTVPGTSPQDGPADITMTLPADPSGVFPVNESSRSVPLL